MEPDSILEYRHPSNYVFTMYTPDEKWGGFQIRYDERGLRSDPAGIVVYDSRLHTRPIAFLGDSFVEGNQMPYDKSIVGLLNSRALNDVFVLNFGVSSYSPVVYNLQWRNSVEEFGPVHIFVLLFSNDIADDQRRADLAAAHSLIDRRGIITGVPSLGNDWLRRLLRQVYLARLIRRAQLQVQWIFKTEKAPIEGAVDNVIEENPDISKLTSDHLLAMISEVRKSGSKITLLAVPSKYRILKEDGHLKNPTFANKVYQWAHQNGVDYLDLTADFSRFKKEENETISSPFLRNDIHFNEAGSEIVSRKIAEMFPEYFSALMTKN